MKRISSTSLEKLLDKRQPQNVASSLWAAIICTGHWTPQAMSHFGVISWELQNQELMISREGNLKQPGISDLIPIQCNPLITTIVLYRKAKHYRTVISLTIELLSNTSVTISICTGQIGQPANALFNLLQLFQ